MSEYYGQPGGDSAGAATAAGGLHVSTTFDVPGMRVTRYCGSCFGVVVRSMGFAKGVGAAFKSLAGGEVHQYTQLLEDSRRHALDRMVQNAQVLGANAVIGFRFDSSEIGQSMTEIVAYGTAVIVTPDA